MNKLTDIFEAFLIGVQYTLAMPLILYSITVHCFEGARIKHEIYKDRLFMKRFNLIDQEHVHDFLKWNGDYKEKRNAR